MIDNFDLKVGLSSSHAETVTELLTARRFGSGELLVYATPAMIALMEKTCNYCVKQYLPDGYCSVGTSISVKYISATPVGMKVRVISELIEIDGRRLIFSVKAYDETALVGEGTHERFIVESEAFSKKAASKLVH